LAVGEVGVHDLEQCSKEQSIGRGLVQGQISSFLDVLEIPLPPAAVACGAALASLGCGFNLL
jgi:hypothetical protein